MKQTLDNSQVILQFSDSDNVIHEIGLDSILNGGYPLNEDGSDMEYLSTFMLTTHNQ